MVRILVRLLLISVSVSVSENGAKMAIFVKKRAVVPAYDSRQNYK